MKISYFKKDIASQKENYIYWSRFKESLYLPMSLMWSLDSISWIILSFSRQMILDGNEVKAYSDRKFIVWIDKIHLFKNKSFLRSQDKERKLDLENRIYQWIARKLWDNTVNIIILSGYSERRLFQDNWPWSVSLLLLMRSILLLQSRERCFHQWQLIISIHSSV